jgi:hypothetical protein
VSIVRTAKIANQRLALFESMVPLLSVRYPAFL